MPTSSLGLQVPTPLAEQSRKTAYDKELRMKSSLESVYTTLKGQYNTEKKTIPNAIYMTISDKALSDSWKARITMKLPLRGDGVFGNAEAIGQEEQADTKACEIYRNNCRKVVSTPGYGTTKLDADYLGLFQQHIDDLAAWNKEQEDLEIHQALLQTYGQTLWVGDTASTCQPNWNPNVIIAGQNAYAGGLPEYSPNSATYSQRISAAIAAANGGAGPSVLNQLALSNISNFALKKRIDRLDIPGLPGGKGYVLTISELQAMYLGDPAWAANNLGSLYIKAAALPDKVMNWPGVLGAFKDLLIVVDVRASTLERIDANNLAARYVKPGDRDERLRGATGVYDVAVVHGKGALWKWEPEPLHNITQTDDYGKIVGTGTACVRGIGIPIYRRDLDASPIVNTEIEQVSSAVVICGMPAAPTVTP